VLLDAKLKFIFLSHIQRSFVPSSAKLKPFLYFYFCITHAQQLKYKTHFYIHAVHIYKLIFYYYTNICINKWCKINIKITPTCFDVNTSSSGGLQVLLVKLWINTMIKYNIVMCCYDRMLVNMAAYVIPG